MSASAYIYYSTVTDTLTPSRQNAARGAIDFLDRAVWPFETRKVCAGGTPIARAQCVISQIILLLQP